MCFLSFFLTFSDSTGNDLTFIFLDEPPLPRHCVPGINPMPGIDRLRAEHNIEVPPKHPLRCNKTSCACRHLGMLAVQVVRPSTDPARSINCTCMKNICKAMKLFSVRRQKQVPMSTECSYFHIIKQYQAYNEDSTQIANYQVARLYLYFI